MVPGRLLIGGGGDTGETSLPLKDEFLHDRNLPDSGVDGPPQGYGVESTDRYPDPDADQRRVVGHESELEEPQGKEDTVGPHCRADLVDARCQPRQGLTERDVGGEFVPFHPVVDFLGTNSGVAVRIEADQGRGDSGEDDARHDSYPPAVIPGVLLPELQDECTREHTTAECSKCKPHTQISKKPSHDPGRKTSESCWA